MREIFFFAGSQVRRKTQYVTIDQKFSKPPAPPVSMCPCRFISKLLPKSSSRCAPDVTFAASLTHHIAFIIAFRTACSFVGPIKLLCIRRPTPTWYLCHTSFHYPPRICFLIIPLYIISSTLLPQLSAISLLPFLHRHTHSYFTILYGDPCLLPNVYGDSKLSTSQHGAPFRERHQVVMFDYT